MVGLLGWLMGLSLTAALLIGIVAVGDAAIDDARAATAADAAALAGAAGGSEAAQVAAERNGATLVRVSFRGSVTSVEVRLGDARAVAHAERLIVRDG
ncbi:MAG: helicase [Acidimicrobiia bacterium]|nr:helicase [Acidimicrobiia bacterium]